MPLYRVDFLDRGDNIYRMDYIECFHDEGAIAVARRLNVSIGVIFEIWQDERLVHREQTVHDPKV